MQGALPGLAVLPGLAGPHDGAAADTGVVRLARRGGVRVPRSFVETGRRVACHRDGGRWGLLYRVLWRLVTTEPHLLADAADPDVRRLALLEGQVRRDVHKMHAFVRFRKVAGDGWPGGGPGTPGGAGGRSSAGGEVDMAGSGRERFVAWHEPDHRVLRLAVPFFVERFSTLDWAILTPDGSAVFDGREVRFGPPPARPPRDLEDDLEGLWCSYYAAVFNPNRVKVAAMAREMPRRFWKNLPETRQLDELLADAAGRASEMLAAGRGPADPAAEGARPFVPRAAAGGRLTLRQIYDALPACRGCSLCENGTRPVAGEGPDLERARDPDDLHDEAGPMMLVGEQPGDTEAERGRPFAGPAGAVLDRALVAAGLRREAVYLTNAVKHFRFELRGKRRIHLRPAVTDVHACRPWLEAECAVLRPGVVVALGTTAARSMLGASAPLQMLRGKVLTDTEWAPRFVVTHHPAAVLRASEPARQRQLFEELVGHLRLAGGAAGAGGGVGEAARSGRGASRAPAAGEVEAAEVGDAEVTPSRRASSRASDEDERPPRT